MKRYEGLFILNIIGKEEGVTEVIEKIRKDIEAVGGKVETTQKMDKRPFSRIANKKYTAGFYLNVIFASAPAALAALKSRFCLSEDIFRVIFSAAPALKEAAK